MIALGIGMSVSTFSVTNSVLLRQVNFPDGDRLVRIFRTSPDSQSNWNSPANFLLLREAATSFSSIADFTPHDRIITEQGQPPEVKFGLIVTANFLTTLRIQPILGRGLLADEDQPGKGSVVLLTKSYWASRFGGDPSIIGRTLRVGVDMRTVVGILPDFDTTTSWHGTSFVVPVTMWPGFATTRSAKWFDIVARLKPGVSLQQAQSELSLLASRIDHDFPADNGNDGFRVTYLAASDVDNNSRTLYWLTVCFAALVLLIACANLASLQLTRAHSRAYEYAIRSALGASRLDLVSAMLVESLLLTLAGGLLGVLIGYAANHLISRYFWENYPIPLDGRVLLFAVGVSLVTGLSFGLAPAWIASNVSTGDALKESSRGTTSGRSHRRFRFLLVIGQLASALVLVSAALSFGVAIKYSLKRGLGWEPAGLFSGFLDINRDAYKPDDAKRAFLDRLEGKLASIPGVSAAAVTSAEPFYGYFGQERIAVEGLPPEPVGRETPAQAVAVDSRYFSVVGIPLKAGSNFHDNVRADRPHVIVINEGMARLFWPGQSAIGKRVRFISETTWNEVIGVVADVRMAAGFDAPYSRLQIYRALQQAPSIHYTFVLKTALPPEAMFVTARKAIHDLDPDLILEGAGSVEEGLRRLFSGNDLIIFSLGAFAIVGFLIAIVGLYAVISELTVQRSREMGIRIAVGASYAAIIRLIISQGAWLVLWGVVVGLGGAFGVSRIYRHTMPELNPPSTSVECLMTVLLCVAGIAACYVPARRAGKTDPIRVLRSE
jgi:putative ABC transport system permease protein